MVQFVEIKQPNECNFAQNAKAGWEVVGLIIQLKGVAVFAGNNDAAVPESKVERPQGTAQSMQIAHQTLIINYTSLTIYKVENDISH